MHHPALDRELPVEEPANRLRIDAVLFSEDARRSLRRSLPGQAFGLGSLKDPVSIARLRGKDLAELTQASA